jgi:hypothetical protein
VATHWIAAQWVSAICGRTTRPSFAAGASVSPPPDHLQKRNHLYTECLYINYHRRSHSGQVCQPGIDLEVKVPSL